MKADTVASSGWVFLHPVPNLQGVRRPPWAACLQWSQHQSGGNLTWDATEASPPLVPDAAPPPVLPSGSPLPAEAVTITSTDPGQGLAGLMLPAEGPP